MSAAGMASLNCSIVLEIAPVPPSVTVVPVLFTADGAEVSALIEMPPIAHFVLFDHDQDVTTVGAPASRLTPPLADVL